MADEIKLSKQMAVKVLIKQCEKSRQAFADLENILTAYNDLLCFENGTATREQVLRMPMSMKMLESPETVMNGIIKDMETVRQALCAMSQLGEITEWSK